MSIQKLKWKVIESNKEYDGFFITEFVWAAMSWDKLSISFIFVTSCSFSTFLLAILMPTAELLWSYVPVFFYRYAVMLNCWKYESASRPHFVKLYQTMDTYIKTKVCHINQDILQKLKLVSYQVNCEFLFSSIMWCQCRRKNLYYHFLLVLVFHSFVLGVYFLVFISVLSQLPVLYLLYLFAYCIYIGCA